ncbi:MAG TPA: ABC transporter ATP-binding protein [Ilumatobacter sp.]|nr:ABC transporter ATP-binding protein [Ilumatobacter sp.]
MNFTNVSKTFGGAAGAGATIALNDVSLAVPSGRVTTLVGPSGCGKSTLLNIAAGLLEPDQGRVQLDGHDVHGPDDGTAVVFQQANLLPWRTAARNVAYGMELQRRLSADQRRQRSQLALELVGLDGFGNHYPHQLSGGMQQRVNLARALATEPKVLLMDEPFGALDALTKESMQEELQRIVQASNVTVLFITHDIAEAVFLGDKVVVMAARPGRVLEELEVGEAKPRSAEFRYSKEFTELEEHLWSQLKAASAAVAPAR